MDQLPDMFVVVHRSSSKGDTPVTFSPLQDSARSKIARLRRLNPRATYMLYTAQLAEQPIEVFPPNPNGRK